MNVLGGTLFQLIVPLTFAGYFAMKHDWHAATVPLWWTGQNCWNIARYISDARAQDLPLVGAASMTGCGYWMRSTCCTGTWDRSRGARGGDPAVPGERDCRGDSRAHGGAGARGLVRRPADSSNAKKSAGLDRPRGDREYRRPSRTGRCGRARADTGWTPRAAVPRSGRGSAPGGRRSHPTPRRWDGGQRRRGAG